MTEPIIKLVRDMSGDGEVSRRMQNLRLLDLAVQDADDDPAQQAGLLMMAMVLTIRRVLSQNKITDRGPRMKVIKAAVAEFDSKLRDYVKQ